MSKEPSEMCAILDAPTADQIAAAAQLRLLYMPLWAASADGLDTLRDAVPGFTAASTWLKVSALRQLFSTGLLSNAVVQSLVANILGVMAGFPAADAELVSAIAAVPAMPTLSTASNRVVFASKFVHFFADPPGAVPMYDRWARRRLNSHFRPDDLDYEYPTYAEFFLDADALRASVVGLPFLSFRALDQYLYLAGMRQAWTTAVADESPPPDINDEAARVFATGATGADPLLAALLAALSP